ncbi:MAG: GerMN domain-containing protein [Thermodesulfobacteriota bacterium]
MAAVVFGIAATGILRYLPEQAEQPGATTRAETRPGSGEKTDVYLYFATGDGATLAAEKRVVETSADPARLAGAIIDGLARGPKRDDLVRTVPPETACRALYVTADRTAYVDFTPAIREGHPGGAQAELLTIYAIVNSLAINVDGIDRVKFLIDGREADTLAGHVDLGAAFAPDLRIVR